VSNPFAILSDTSSCFIKKRNLGNEQTAMAISQLCAPAGPQGMSRNFSFKTNKSLDEIEATKKKEKKKRKQNYQSTKIK